MLINKSQLCWVLLISMLSGCPSYAANSCNTHQIVDRPVADKKLVFFKLIIPLLVAKNETILNERRMLLALKDEKNLSIKDKNWLSALCGKYQAQCFDSDGGVPWQELDDKVDIIPLELASIQSALESTWGTSTLARKKNNYFGVKGPSGYKKYHDLKDSIDDYYLRLNTQDRYIKFRQKRTSLRVGNVGNEACELVNYMGGYAKRDKTYIEYLSIMLASNKNIITRFVE